MHIDTAADIGEIDLELTNIEVKSMIFVMPQQPRRSKSEIAEELRLLRGLSNKIPTETAFGDDNREAIRTEIHVISSEMTMAQLIERYEDGDTYTLSAALNALEWLRDDGPAPSEDWKSMIAA